MFSSVRTPEAEQPKKPKANTEKSAKKRKRESEPPETAQVATEPSAKKSKRRKSEHTAEDAQAVVAHNDVPRAASAQQEEKPAKAKAFEEPQTNGTNEVQPAKKVKKSKKSDGGVVKRAVEETQPAAAAAEPTPAKEKKQKKQRSKEDGESTSRETAETIRPGPSTVDATPATKKRHKKDRQSVSNEDPSAQAVVQAGPSRSQHTSRADAQGPREAMSNEQHLQKHSPFVQRTETLYLALSPCANNFPLEGLIAEHISPLLLTYYPPLKGVVLKYSNARLSETPEGGQNSQKSDAVVLSKAIDEYAVTFVYLTADFILFSPTKGSYLEGYVNLQNESLLGLVSYNYFNAGIERQRLPKEWRWVEHGSQSDARTGKGSGHWVDGSGNKVDGKVIFRVKDFEAAPGGENGAGSINISGTLLSAAEDKKADEEEKPRSSVAARKK